MAAGQRSPAVDAGRVLGAGAGAVIRGSVRVLLSPARSAAGTGALPGIPSPSDMTYSALA